MLNKIKNINLEKIIPRLITTWFFITLLNLIKDAIFNNITYLQNISFIYYIILYIIFFILFTTLKKLNIKIELDSTLMLINYCLCSYFWIKNIQTNFLFLLIIIIFFIFIIIHFLNKNQEVLNQLKIKNKLYKPIIISIVSIPFIILLIISILRYFNFHSPNFDFGIFSHIFYNLKETFIPFSTCERDILLSHFAVHFSPILYLILPVYFLFSHPITLQVIQVLLVFSGIIPIIKLCKHFNLSKNKILILSLIYSFYPIVSCGCLFDFHENAFLLPLLLWVFYFFEKNKKIPMYLFIILTLLVKEDAAVYIMIFALYQIISRKKYLQGSIILGISIIYFLIATYIINTFGLGIMADRFENITYNDAGLIGAVKTIIINPGFALTQLLTIDKLKYILLLLLPLSFLPFITKNISRYILLLPILINILTNYTYSYDINFHYSFAITAFLFYLSIQNLSELKNNYYLLLGIGIFSTLIIYQTYLIPDLTDNVNVWKVNKEKYIELENILKEIPEESSVSASALLVPHLTNREYIYEIYYHENKLDIDYVIIDMRYDDNNQETIDHYLNNGYELFLEKELVTILKNT